jgi:predicted PurR-regulated permease PerM
MYSRFYQRSFLIATAALLGYALVRMLDPFWGALGWAAFLAFLLNPVHTWLTRKLHGRAAASAGVIVALTPFFVIAPLTILGLIFASQLTALIEYLKERELTSYPELLAQLERFPLLGRLVTWIRSEVSVTAEQIQEWAAGGAQKAVEAAASVGGNVVLGVAGTLVGFFLMLFLLFFFLRDGRVMLAHVGNLIPMNVQRRQGLTKYLGEVTRAVVYGSALTAVIQGILSGIGFAIAGLPSPVVFAVLAGICAFIPATGTGLVLIPGVLFLALSGRWGAAAFLAAWSVGVGFSDNLLRPFLTAQRAEVSTLAVFVGVIGGVSAFGFIGLFIGPVVLSLIVALLRFGEEVVEKGRSGSG